MFCATAQQSTPLQSLFTPSQSAPPPCCTHTGQGSRLTASGRPGDDRKCVHIDHKSFLGQKGLLLLSKWRLNLALVHQSTSVLAVTMITYYYWLAALHETNKYAARRWSIQPYHLCQNQLAWWLKQEDSALSSLMSVSKIIYDNLESEVINKDVDATLFLCCNFSCICDHSEVTRWHQNQKQTL